MERWREGEEVQPGHSLTPVPLSQLWSTAKRQKKETQGDIRTRNTGKKEIKWAILT